MSTTIFNIAAIIIICIVIVTNFINIYTGGDINNKLPLDRQKLLDDIKETPNKILNSKLLVYFHVMESAISNNRDIKIALFDTFLIIMTTRANMAVNISYNEIECFKKALLPNCYLLLYNNERYILKLNQDDANYIKQKIGG